MILFLYGEDTYRSSQKLHQIRDKFKKEVDTSGMNIDVVNAEDVSPEQLTQFINAAPFLAPKRMIIVKNALSGNKSKDHRDTIDEIIVKRGSDNDTILVFWESNTPKTKLNVWKKLEKEKFAQQFNLLDQRQVIQWIQQEVISRKGTIEASAADLLARTLGSDLWSISNEIDKLIHFTNGTAITPAKIEELIPRGSDDNIFNFIDAIGTKRKKDALQLLSDQFSSGANELYLLTMITKQLKNIIGIKALLLETPGATKQIIAQTLKIHPFVAQKSMAQAQYFDLPRAVSMFGALTGIDYKIKSSSVNPRLLLETFIAKL